MLSKNEYTFALKRVNILRFYLHIFIYSNEVAVVFEWHEVTVFESAVGQIDVTISFL